MILIELFQKKKNGYILCESMMNEIVGLVEEFNWRTITK
jgi:hypothetical protein